MRLSRLVNQTIIATLLIQVSTAAYATAANQAHFRTGFIKGSYSGKAVDPVSLMSLSSGTIEYEIFASSRRSTILRTTVAMNLSTSNLQYFSVGAGQRYYFSSTGMIFDREESNIHLISIPKLRYYADWTGGLGTVVLDEGLVYEKISSIINLGMGSGVLYSINPKVSLELNVGFTYSWGFSSIAVAGTTIHALLGIAFNF